MWFIVPLFLLLLAPRSCPSKRLQERCGKLEQENKQLQGFSEKYFALMQQLQDSEEKHLQREREIRRLKKDQQQQHQQHAPSP